VVANLEVTNIARFGGPGLVETYKMPLSVSPANVGQVLSCQGTGQFLVFVDPAPPPDPLTLSTVNVTGTGIGQGLNVTGTTTSGELRVPGPAEFGNDLNNSRFYMPQDPATNGKVLTATGVGNVAVWAALPPAGPQASIESFTEPLTARVDCNSVEVTGQGHVVRLESNKPQQFVQWNLPQGFQFEILTLGPTAVVTVPVVIETGTPGLQLIAVEEVRRQIQYKLTNYVRSQFQTGIQTFQFDLDGSGTDVKFIWRLTFPTRFTDYYVEEIRLLGSGSFPDQALIGAFPATFTCSAGQEAQQSLLWPGIVVQPSTEVMSVDGSSNYTTSLSVGNDGTSYSLPRQKPPQNGGSGVLADYSLMYPPIVGQDWYYLAYPNVVSYDFSGFVSATAGGLVNLPWSVQVGAGAHGIYDLMELINARIAQAIVDCGATYNVSTTRLLHYRENLNAIVFEVKQSVNLATVRFNFTG
jgi:hypothetical protein